jgi:hypothetical protein
MEPLDPNAAARLRDLEPRLSPPSDQSGEMLGRDADDRAQ